MGYRLYFVVEQENLNIGIDIKIGGPFYVEAEIPIAIKLPEKLIWITTHPACGFNAYSLVHVPNGGSWNPKDKYRFTMSLGTRFMGENPAFFYWNGGISFPL